MLGENHSLAHEFPDYKDAITRLTENDENFARTAKKYDNLDKEIRKLELDGAPISDEAMHQKKFERAALKDSLYQCLVKFGDS